MDLQGLIDSRIEQVLSKSQFLNSLPCEVLSVDGQMATVRLTTNDVIYTVPSYVGTVNVGDYVKLYFNGIAPNERNSYIGATSFTDSVGELVTVVGTDVAHGSMPYGDFWWFDDKTVVQKISFAGGTSVYGQIISNFDVYSTQANTIHYAIFVNNACIIERTALIEADSTVTLSTVQPFMIPERENTVEIRAYALLSCSITFSRSYVSGYGIIDISQHPKLASLNIDYSGDGTIQAGTSIEFDVLTENSLGLILYRSQPQMTGKFHITKNGKTLTVAVDSDAPVDGEFTVQINTSQEFTEVPFRVTEPPYTPTTEDDYIVDDDSNILYYIGSAINPEVPNELNDLPVKKLYSTAFDYSNVRSVYIPEGVEEIQ